MFNISLNKIITLNRGDYGSFTIKLNKGTTINPDIIELGEHDYVYVGVMQFEDFFEKSLIRKAYNMYDLNEDGSLTIEINPTDTEFLMPGTYYYEIKVVINKEVEPEEYVEESGEEPIYKVDKVYTIAPRTRFIIEE